jgi:exodeoxyribonuclease VII small subunit
MEKKNKNNFEQNLKRLQEISELLENENLGLEESINLYEEGVSISRICLDELKKAELKISHIKSKAKDILNEESVVLNNGEDD